MAQEALQLVGHSLQNLSIGLNDIHGEITLGNARSAIPLFSGRRESYVSWRSAVDKYAFLTNANDAATIRLAYQTAIGIASDIIQRFTTANPAATWQELKNHLDVRLGDGDSSELAWDKLKNYKQRIGQSVQIFAEHLQGQLLKAFPPPNDINDAVIQKLAVQTFMDGLIENNIARTLLRNPPATLSEATNLAAREANVQHRIKLHGRDERTRPAIPDFRQIVPMEVDVMTKSANLYVNRQPARKRQETPQTCYYCKKRGHLKKDCYALKREMASSPYPKRTGSRPPYKRADKQPDNKRSQLKWTADGKPICIRCNKPGHIGKDCYKFKNRGRSATASQPFRNNGNSQPRQQPESSHYYPQRVERSRYYPPRDEPMDVNLVHSYQSDSEAHNASAQPEN